MKKITLILLLLICSFTNKALAAAWYTNTTSSITAAGAATNWTNDPTGATGYSNPAFAATDTFTVLSGGVVTITNTVAMTIGALTIKSGGSVTANMTTAITTTITGNLTIDQGGSITTNTVSGSVFRTNGTLNWNGTIRTNGDGVTLTAGGNFSTYGNITGATAMHDVNSDRAIYIVGSGKTINLKQVPGLKDKFAGLQIALNPAGNLTLAGDCVIYDPIFFNNANAKNLDLAGFSLQTTLIRNESPTTGTGTITGSATSNLTISGGYTTSYFKLATGGETFNSINLDTAFNAGTGTTTITGNPTVNTLTFGLPTGDTSVKKLIVTGNFTLADNGTMRVEAKGTAVAGTDYSQLAVTGNTTIGTNTTLKIDYINGYTPALGAAFNFGTYTVANTGTFTTMTPSAGTGTTIYTSNKITYTNNTSLSTQKNTIAEGIQMYPNPITNVLNINAPRATAAIAVQVVDLSGKTVASTVSNTTSATVSLSSAAAGIYLVKVTDGKSSYTQKVIKK